MSNDDFEWINPDDVSKESFERVLRDSAYEIGEHLRILVIAGGNAEVRRIPVSYKDTVKQIIEKFTAYTKCDFELTRDFIAKYLTGLSYSDILQKGNLGDKKMAAGKKVVALKAGPSPKPVKIVGVKDKYAGLNEKYKELLKSLKPEDQEIYFRYKDNYATWASELETLLRLSNDLMLRKAAMKEDEESTYGKNLVPTLADLFGIPDSSVWTGIGAVETFTLERLLIAVNEVASRGGRVTMSHLRQLDRLSSDDWTEQRENLFKKVVAGELVSYRDVEAAVDTILGRTRASVSVEVKQTTNDISDPYASDLKLVNKGESASEDADDEYTDAMAPLSPPSEIIGLCVNMNASVAVTIDKLRKWSDNLHDWWQDASIETFETLRIETLTETTDQLYVLIKKVEQVITQFQDISKSAVETQKPLKKLVPVRKTPISGKPPVDVQDHQLARAN
jgi:hypothetical protein